MKRFIALWMLLATSAARTQELTEIACGRSLEKQGAPPQLVLDPTLRVMDQTKAAAKFDPGIPPSGYAIKSIFCARSDIVPAPFDYKVVQAGYPLMIFARDKAATRTRIAVLEMNNGQLRLRSVGQAGFTPEMSGRIQRFLDASLPEFGKMER
jgi:hypothetical protein